jgi:3,4-dihydroxy 2-butanone 4-phosphate synthase/GTP cyclohydrolase II
MTSADLDLLPRRHVHEAISSTEELIAEARAGRMFILVDDEDRENEGDLIIPAQFATPQALAFMMRHARGLICLSMTSAHVTTLGLPMMAVANAQRHQTAFTVSIDAREGLRNGVSARDRAHTIAVAINPETTPRLGMCFRLQHAPAARWCGPAIPRRRWISPAWPGCFPPG